MRTNRRTNKARVPLHFWQKKSEFSEFWQCAVSTTFESPSFNIYALVEVEKETEQEEEKVSVYSRDNEQPTPWNTDVLTKKPTFRGIRTGV